MRLNKHCQKIFNQALKIIWLSNSLWSVASICKFKCCENFLKQILIGNEKGYVCECERERDRQR